METKIVTVTVSGVAGSRKSEIAEFIAKSLRRLAIGDSHTDETVGVKHVSGESTMAGIKQCAGKYENLVVVTESNNSFEQTWGKQNRYTCVSKPGEYEMVGTSSGSGNLKGLPVIVYRDVATGRLFHREPENFMARMKKIPAEPAINHEMLAAMQQARQWIAENSGAETAPAQLHLMDAMIAKAKGEAV